jgi:hypothetical protein
MKYRQKKKKNHKNRFFAIINRIDKPLANLTIMKREKYKINENLK